MPTCRLFNAILSATLPCVMLIGSALPASAYGAQGHRAVAKVAQERLSDKARAGIQKILGSNDLVGVAMWPDELKQAKKKKGSLKNDPEAKKFNIDFPKNGAGTSSTFPLDRRATN